MTKRIPLFHCWKADTIDNRACGEFNLSLGTFNYYTATRGNPAIVKRLLELIDTLPRASQLHKHYRTSIVIACNGHSKWITTFAPHSYKTFQKKLQFLYIVVNMTMNEFDNDNLILLITRFQR